ncbi:MAG: phage tail assembly protein [Pseudomonadota bacterium]
MFSPVTIQLTFVITGDVGEIRSITLRQPTAGDMADIGSPLMHKNSGVFPRCDVILNYVERLSGVKKAHLRKMTHTDFGKCMEAVILMFDQENSVTRPKRWR